MHVHSHRHEADRVTSHRSYRFMGWLLGEATRSHDGPALICHAARAATSTSC